MRFSKSAVFDRDGRPYRRNNGGVSPEGCFHARRSTWPLSQYLAHVSSNAKSLHSEHVLRFCVNFWAIFGHSVNEIFFLKG